MKAMASSDSSGPDAQDKALEDAPVGALMNELSGYVSLLSSKPVEDYDSAEIHFVRVSLKPVLVSILSKPDASDSDSAARKQLFDEIVNLAVSTNLSCYVLFAVFCFFSDVKSLPNIVTNIVLTGEQRESVLNMQGRSSVLREPATSVIHSMVEEVYNGALFAAVRKMIEERKMTLNQITTLLRLFGVTEPYLDDAFAVAVASYYMEYVITVFSDRDVDGPAVPHLMRFIVTFTEMLSDQWKQILMFLFGVCERTERHSEVVVQFLALFVKVAVKNEEIVHVFKKEFFDLVRKVRKRTMLSELYELLVTIFQRIGVSASDLTMLLYQSPLMKEECGMCILKMLPRVMESVDDLCCRILAFGVFCPSLHMALLDRCEDEAISHALFTQLIECDKWCEEDCVVQTKTSEKMNALLQKEIERLNDEKHTTNVGWILAKFPRLELIHDYIAKVFSMRRISDRVEKAVMNLCHVFAKLEGEKIVSFLIGSVIDILSSNVLAAKKTKLAAIAVYWLSTIHTIPEGPIFQKLVGLDYTKAPSQLHGIISTLLLRSSNKRSSRALLLKLMKDTVKPQHAHWAINLALTVANDDKKECDKLADQLMVSLNDDSKRKNAIYLIYFGVLRECDFYRVGDSFGFVQKVIVDGETMNVSLHPYHSARRIYAEVAAMIKHPMSQFHLVDGDDVLLKKDGPLTSLRLSRTQPLVYHVVMHEQNDDCTNGQIVPHFMEYLGQQDHFNSLFNQMNNFSPENEVLFQLLTLFNCQNQTALVTPIQLMFRGEFIISFEYGDSVRLFPFLIKKTLESHQSLSSDFVEQLLKLLSQQPYDVVSLAIMCDSVAKLNQKFSFDVRLTKTCLIDSTSLLLRETFLELMSDRIDQDLLVSILHLTVYEEKRHNTKQFFEVLKRTKVSSDVVFPFFQDLEQYEKSLYSNTDETFIGMLSILDTSDQVLDLVMRRLAACPTCYSCLEPFVHTLESRRAALAFMERGNRLEKFYGIVASLPMVPSPYLRVKDDLTSRGRNLVVGDSLVHCFFQALSSISLFTQAMTATEFESDYLKHLAMFFAETAYGVSGYIQGYDFRIESDKVTDIIDTLFGYINCELGETSSATTMFKGMSETGQFYCLSIDASKYQSLVDVCLGVVRWPDYLMLSIERGSDPTSLFEIPMIYKPNEAQCYEASAMIVEDAQKQLSVIFCGYDREWYVRSGNEIQYFDIAEYANWTFGKHPELSDELTSAAIFIIYKKSGVDESPESAQIRPDTERFVNQKNLEQWPSILCATDHFIDFVQQSTTEERLNQPKHLEFVFQVLTKVVILSEPWLMKWLNWFTDTVLADSSRSQLFTEYLFTNINKTIVELAALSSAASVQLPKFVLAAIVSIPQPITSIRKIIDSLEFAVNELQFGFACDILDRILQLSIDWTSESELLRSILDLLVRGRENCNVSAIFGRVLAAFDSFMAVVGRLVRERVYNETIALIFTTEFLEQWVDFEERSSSFADVIKTVNAENGEIFSSLMSLSERVQKLLQEIVVLHNPINVPDLKFLPFEQFSPAFQSILFCDNSLLRTEILRVTKQLLPKPQKDVVAYLDRALITDVQPPALGSESCWSQSFLTFIPMAMQTMSTRPENCGEFLELIELLTLLAPISLSLFFPEMLSIFAQCDASSPLIVRVMNILRNMLILDPSLLESLPSESVEKMLRTRYGGRPGVQILKIIANNASVDNSELSGSCVERGLSDMYGEHTEALVAMIDGGLVPGAFSVPAAPPDMMCLKLANSLCRNLPNLRKNLAKYMKRVLDTAVPIEMFKLSPSIREALDIVKGTK